MQMSVDDYVRCDAVELARLVREGAVSAADLAETARALIERRSALNAVADLAEPADDVPPAAGPRCWTG